MSAPIAGSGTLRFGPFEADLRSSELRKDGVKVKLEGQPLQILAVLLERPGQLVTREELKKELWPDETFVDFEQGINAAVKRLRVALEDSADTPRFIETLPRRGYRFIGRLENGGQSPSLAEESELSPPFIEKEVAAKHAEPTKSAAPTKPWRTLAITGAAIAACAILVVVGLNLNGLRDRLLNHPRAGEITSLAVLPLANLTGDPGQDYFADGMTEALISELGRVSAIRVISRTSAMAFKNVNKPLPDVARQLGGVDAVLEGAVTRNGDRVRITARLMRSSDERTLWNGSYERDLRDIQALQSDIVLVVADEIRVKLLTHEQARLAGARPVNPRAYEAYLMGRYLQARRTPEDMRKAWTYFQHALEIDPTYAPAYLGIVDCYSIGGGRHMGISIKEADARMKEAARKVVQLDPTTAAAHYAIAMMKWHDWDFPGAEAEFQRSLELNPGDVQVRQHYAHYLLSTRRPLEARREIQHALVLDPLSPMFTVDLGHTYFYARQYAEAIQQGQKALAMERDYKYARMMLGSSYWNAGQVREALEAGWPNPFRPEQNRHAKEIYERAGVEPMLRWLLQDVEQGNPTGAFYSRSSEVARWYAQLGEDERALTWLKKAYEEHDPWLPMDLAGPGLDRLSSNPEFQDLLRRMGLPQ